VATHTLYLVRSEHPAWQSLRFALDAWPETNCRQVYGQTERAGVISTLSPAAHRDASRPERLGSAGTVVPGTELRVVDPETGRDVAHGIADSTERRGRSSEAELTG